MTASRPNEVIALRIRARSDTSPTPHFLPQRIYSHNANTFTTQPHSQRNHNHNATTSTTQPHPQRNHIHNATTMSTSSKLEILSRCDVFDETERYRHSELMYKLDNAVYTAKSKVRYGFDANVSLEDLYEVKHVTTMSTSSELEILSRSEVFKMDGGISRYLHSELMYKLDNAMYTANSKVRYGSDAEVKLEDLYEVEEVVEMNIPDCPEFPSDLTQASNPPPAGWHIKDPTLIYFSPSNPIWTGERILSEAKLNECLMTHPHRNLAKYHGCLVQDGLITGLCFDKYHETLEDRMNRLSPSRSNIKNISLMLESIRNGLEHLHSLGFAHNNINDKNIMFFNKDSDEAVIINLGSCRPIGSPLDDFVVRKAQWYDKKVNTSLPSNDLDVLHDIEECFSGTKNYKILGRGGRVNR
ncbi:hypothetical protein GJ744_006049 [Endocarpon pusillum]|uniref:Protein kinase domain-containing protein n=1 Tax=Endocarpon pusillum TaxID=364733 RepID=A0A8H7AK94_9EURO|nr:hypothetical protein GJ744_006049 [Endocarpon pusillum]